jgi:hypothetical protein
VFSNVKVWDLDSVPPPVPVLSEPAAGAVLASRLAFLAWSAPGQTRFQARVNSVDDPDAGIAWDSQEVPSAQASIHAGPLPDGRSYYAFVRAGSATEWSGWSAPGRSFRVDSSSPPAGPDLVRIEGNVLADRGGPFLALGASYFSALRIARDDPARLLSDLDFLASGGLPLSPGPLHGRLERVVAGPRDRSRSPSRTRTGSAVAAWPELLAAGSGT